MSQWAAMGRATLVLPTPGAPPMNTTPGTSPAFADTIAVAYAIEMSSRRDADFARFLVKLGRTIRLAMLADIPVSPTCPSAALRTTATCATPVMSGISPRDGQLLVRLRHDGRWCLPRLSGRWRRHDRRRV